PRRARDHSRRADPPQDGDHPPADASLDRSAVGAHAYTHRRSGGRPAARTDATRRASGPRTRSSPHRRSGRAAGTPTELGQQPPRVDDATAASRAPAEPRTHSLATHRPTRPGATKSHARSPHPERARPAGGPLRLPLFAALPASTSAE